MDQTFVGEIHIFACNFAPNGWAKCNGQLLLINQNTALFSLLGTTYGGDGKTTFALPNLQGVAPLGVGQGKGLSPYVCGQYGGEKAVTLIQPQMPAHNYRVRAKNVAGNKNQPGGNFWASAHSGRTTFKIYSPDSADKVDMSTEALAGAGDSQPHNNMPPYLVLNFCIALTGIYPSPY